MGRYNTQQVDSPLVAKSLNIITLLGEAFGACLCYNFCFVPFRVFLGCDALVSLPGQLGIPLHSILMLETVLSMFNISAVVVSFFPFVATSYNQISGEIHKSNTNNMTNIQKLIKTHFHFLRLHLRALRHPCLEQAMPVLEMLWHQSTVPSMSSRLQYPMSRQLSSFSCQ
ncbi:MAG: hypothetical protein AEth_00988 [Candidatus Argoarchaeum ethanivorans]|uniref:Uncharacterized protein n=1 Tax=Candidatus Argoarchaeum ethanivorans TaxID=2608793 RepID=A0A8B3S2S4_9EURY|nr:MAG: hypothetical protein AEth_00988 [Candidatus Argoarchaeum ethanivorans]